MGKQRECSAHTGCAPAGAQTPTTQGQNEQKVSLHCINRNSSIKNKRTYLCGGVKVCVAKSVVIDFELKYSVHIWQLKLDTVFTTCADKACV